jgi:uncharacterized membrane protein
MHKSRLEAFSDGVLAIIMTIMVLELKVPHGQQWSDLYSLRFVALSYVLSFVYVAIYWNNHHHLLQTIKTVNGKILWANMHLLFWLSLVPFVTNWSGENEFSAIPTAVYGFVLFMASVAYYILVRVLVAQEGQHSVIAQAIGKDLKGKISVFLYGISIPLALIHSWVSITIYALIAAIWFIPDNRIEKQTIV